VGLEVAEHLVAVAEDGVVPDARATKRLEHLRPDVPVSFDVLVDLLGPDLEDERCSLGHTASLATRTMSVRGPWTPSTRPSSMSVGRHGSCGGIASLRTPCSAHIPSTTAAMSDAAIRETCAR